MARKRGNPNWGKPMDHAVPVMATEFEKALIKFGLEKAEEPVIARSRNFQVWAHKNQRKHYIPESLLTALGIEVEVEID